MCALVAFGLPGASGKSDPEAPRLLKGFKQGLLISAEREIPVRVARTPQQLTQGVSGILDFEMPRELGVLFDFDSNEKAAEQTRNMWMPNTYFDLDLYCFNKQGVLTDSIAALKKHPGYQEPPTIPRAKPMYCHRILELKTGHPYGSFLKKGKRFSLSE